MSQNETPSPLWLAARGIIGFHNETSEVLKSVLDKLCWGGMIGAVTQGATRMQTPVRILGRMIGAINLNRMIAATALEGENKAGDANLRTLKYKLGVKGDRQAVLNYAQEVLRSIKEW